MDETMSMITGIEWTDATWNPVVGCSYVSAGCRNCYAAVSADKRSRDPKTAAKYGGLTRISRNGVPVWSSVVRLDEKTVQRPFRDKQPKKYFVNSMSDLYHEALSDAEIARVWGVMASAPWHVFQVLTKRPERMRKWLARPETPNEVRAAMLNVDMFTELPAWPLKNVWIGTSVENQRWANARIPDLLACPAEVRFLSAEPLLGPIDLATSVGGVTDNALRTAGLHWVIIGGETGEGARPMHPVWARELRDQCVTAGISVFFKQVGDWSWIESGSALAKAEGLTTDGRRVPYGTPGSQGIVKTGKWIAGRQLDGAIIQEFPEA